MEKLVCRGVFDFGLWPLFFLFCIIHFCNYFLSFGNNQRFSETLSVTAVGFETPVRMRVWSYWFPSGSCCYWLIFTHNHVLASKLPKKKKRTGWRIYIYNDIRGCIKWRTFSLLRRKAAMFWVWWFFFFFICRGYTEYFCILCIFEQGFPRSLWWGRIPAFLATGQDWVLQHTEALKIQKRHLVGPS